MRTAIAFLPGAGAICPDTIINPIDGLADDPRLRDLISRHLRRKETP